MKAPVFITGFQRSGTTLLRIMINSHPEIAIPLDVTGLWYRYYKRISQYNGLATESDVYRLIDDLLKEERIRLWETRLTRDNISSYYQGRGFPDVIAAFYRAFCAAKGKKFWGDKDPGNMRRLHLISEWFPTCKVVHIIRDGRDACLSQLGQDFGFDSLLRCAQPMAA